MMMVFNSDAMIEILILNKKKQVYHIFCLQNTKYFICSIKYVHIFVFIKASFIVVIKTKALLAYNCLLV